MSDSDKKTVGDYALGFWTNYIAPSKKKPLDKKANKFLPRNFDSELKQQGYIKLSAKRRREIAMESPLLMKGIRKKSLDTFRAWITLENINNGNKPADIDLKLIQDFEIRSNYKSKLTEARIASRIYGNGYLLITFLKDDFTKIHEPPAPGAIPYNITILNSEYISELKFLNDNYQKQGVLHFYYNNGRGEEMYIHPDRIQLLPNDKIPGHKLGVSTIDLLRYTMFSKKNIDIASGHILAWFSHGLLDLKIEDAEPEDIEHYEKIANTHPGAWVHDQELELNVKNPTAINPKPFYDYVVLNIAAALNMPTHVLTGVQTGRVTGSEIGFSDYYRDVKDEQELLITPLIRDLYSRILKANGREWKYKISWNPVYVDEAAEVALLEKKVNAAGNALNGPKGGEGFIDKKEARNIFNKGQVELDISKEIKGPPQRPKNPDQDPQPGPRPELKKKKESEKE